MLILEADTKRLLLVSGPLTEGLVRHKMKQNITKITTKQIFILQN